MRRGRVTSRILSHRYPEGVPIDLFTVVVHDYDDAIRFFVDVLGFHLEEDSASLTRTGEPKRWVVVRPGLGQTGIVLAVADGDSERAAIGNQTGGRVGFFLRVDNFDETLERMRDAEVELLTAPRDEPYGRVVVFRDIAGNRWDLLGPRP